MNVKAVFVFGLVFLLLASTVAASRWQTMAYERQTKKVPIIKTVYSDVKPGAGAQRMIGTYSFDERGRVVKLMTPEGEKSARFLKSTTTRGPVSGQKYATESKMDTSRLQYKTSKQYYK